MTKAIAFIGTAIAYAAEAVVDFFMISKFGAAAGVVVTMAIFASPVFISRLF